MAGIPKVKKKKHACKISKDIIRNSAYVSLQTSLSSLRSQPPWHFRSFDMMSLINLFLPFPTTIKKTQAASLTFNLSSWNRKQTCSKTTLCYKTYISNYKRKNGGEKTAVIVSWQFMDFHRPSQPWTQTARRPKLTYRTKMASSELKEANCNREVDISS